ncbi:Sodium/potassium-transporting ATPase subunit beta-2 [Trachymyrmex zeteki]|uniref:Sodium/potassium-transporting ATPase subunit beta-2 n=1 Tax=Mycetomoellerius zeteki TaxID=64791 RepID=A0A151X0I5_9HYME|nr:Sodium/potassium-transporting ATPase subunit beta-2 [Trachymyrmex zeteki]
MSVRGKQVQNGTYEFDYMRAPDTRTRWQIIRDGFHNSTEGTYCGHTPKKWVCLLMYFISPSHIFLINNIITICFYIFLMMLLIGFHRMLRNTRNSYLSRFYNPCVTLIFYACFFAGLAILFSICMKGMLATLSYEKPKWTLSSSIIGTNPGLGFRPISDNPDERSLIWYSASNATDIQKWTQRLDQFLENYISPSLLPNGGRNQQICSYNKPAKPGNVCAVDVNNWGPCSPNQQYGFNNSAPCVFIKLNRIYGWIPEYYNDTQNLSPDMPESLVKYIKSVDASWLNTVWVSCKGENPHDRENIGEINYYPDGHGFPGFYYPYENIPGYLSPVVAVHFVRPTRNQIINIECRAWAKNIEYSSIRSEKKGAVHFELMVDE